MKHYELKEQIDSPTIVDSFTRLLTRVPDKTNVTTHEFQVSLKQLKSRDCLYLATPIYCHTICWQATFIPSSKDEKSYTLQIMSCSAPAVFILESVYIEGSVKFTSPLDTFTEPIYEDSGLYIENFLHEDMFKNINGPYLKFTMTISLHEDWLMPTTHGRFLGNYKGKVDETRWRTDSLFREYLLEYFLYGEPELKRSGSLNLAKTLASYFSNLFSEITMQRCLVQDWSDVVWHLATALLANKEAINGFNQTLMKSGLPKLIAKLLTADFCEGPACIVKMLLPGLSFLLTKCGISMPLFDGAGFDEVFASVIAKFSDERYSVELLSHLMVHFVLLTTSFRVKRSPGKTAEFIQSKVASLTLTNLDDLLPFLQAQTMNIIVRKPGCYYERYRMFCGFFDVLVFMLVDKRKVSKISKATCKKFVETMCENYTSPFYTVAATPIPLPYHILQRSAISTLVNEWCERNSHRSPFLVFPATIRVGVDQIECLTNMINGSSEEENFIKAFREEHRTFIQLLITNYLSVVVSKKHFNIPSTGKSAETLKEEGNKLHEAGEFEKAVEKYTLAIENLEKEISNWRSWNQRKECSQTQLFAKVNLENICRNNRSASYLELKSYNEALADSVLVICELGSLIYGTYPGLESAFYGYSAYEPRLRSRLVVAKIRRVKILVGMSEWVPALNTALELLRNHKDRPTHTISYYYQALVKYSKSVSLLQYPLFCIMCHPIMNEKGSDDSLLILSQTKMRCKRCWHTFCSERCYRKDKTHKTYCAQLAKIRKKRV